MSFRRDGKKDHQKNVEWSDWLLAHQVHLNLLKLPLIVTSDYQHWQDFIDNDAHDPKQTPSQDIVNGMSNNQRKILFDLLKSEYPESVLFNYVCCNFFK